MFAAVRMTPSEKVPLSLSLSLSLSTACINVFKVFSIPCINEGLVLLLNFSTYLHISVTIIAVKMNQKSIIFVHLRIIVAPK